jgi:hypothetical protein
MSAIVPLGQAGGYQRVSGDEFHSREAVNVSQRTAAPQAANTPVGILTTIRRRLTGEGTAAEHFVPREQLLRNAFNPNGETFAQRHAGVVAPAVRVGFAAAAASPVLFGMAKSYQLAVGGSKDLVEKVFLGGSLGFLGGVAGAIVSRVVMGAIAGGSYLVGIDFDKTLETLDKHAGIAKYLSSASLTDVTGQDRTDAVIRMVMNFFAQTSGRATTSASSAENGRSVVLANPKLVAAMQYLATNHLQHLVNIAAAPETVMSEGTTSIETRPLVQAAYSSNKELMQLATNDTSRSGVSLSKELAPFKELMTRHMVFGENRNGKTDFLNGYIHSLFSDVLRRPNQMAILYPYMPKADALKSDEIKDSFGEDCRVEIQRCIINPLHGALIKPGQNPVRTNDHIQAVQAFFKNSDSKLADIATIVDVVQPHEQALTAAFSLVPSLVSGAQSAGQLAFLKIYRGILESAGIPKPIIRESSRKLDAQKVIDTLLRPEKMVADVRESSLA